ncbi:hypothetical protein CPAV1605_517 [seawater metagenome]|uniref:Uncharacterized protein n=1 Tax=seawater metagenome TaxID=1561972 RepID=A0A5E8CLN6_9ZZZZ
MEKKQIYIITDKLKPIGIYTDRDHCLLEYLNKFNMELDMLSNIKRNYGSLKETFLLNLDKLEIQIFIENSFVNIDSIIFSTKEFMFFSSNKNAIIIPDIRFINKLNKIKTLYHEIIETNEFDNINMDNINRNRDNANININRDNIINRNNIYSDSQPSEQQTVKNESQNIKELEAKIEKLNDLKKLQDEFKANEDSTDIHEKQLALVNEKLKSDSSKINELKKKKALIEEKKNIYLADLKIYNLIKEKVENEEIEIPLLFSNKYKVFKKLENSGEITFHKYLNNFPQSVNVPMTSDYQGLFDTQNENKFAYITDDEEYASSSDEQTSAEEESAVI